MNYGKYLDKNKIGQNLTDFVLVVNVHLFGYLHFHC